MKRMMFLLSVLCLQYLLPTEVVFADMYPRIIDAKDISVDNEEAKNIITTQASYAITDISASQAKSEASSSVTMECLEKIGNFDGFAQIRGTADKKTTTGLTLSTPPKMLAKNRVSIMDKNGVPNYITLQQFQYYSKGKSGEFAINHPDPKTRKPAVLYTAAKKGGVVADSRPEVFGKRVPFFGTTAGQPLELADSAETEKTKEDPNGDGKYTEPEIKGMFDPYAAAAGQSLNAANVGPASANTDMKKNNQEANSNPSTPTYHACSVHETWQSGDHSWGTPACGNSSHAGYACQISSDHKDAISCPTQNGISCDYGWHYPCSTHTHAYAAPSYHACGVHETWQSGDHSLTYCYKTNANGTCTVGSYYACADHTCNFPDPPTSVVCAYGHTYDPLVQSQVDFHRTKTCKWCGETWKDCGGGAPDCPTWTTDSHVCSETSHTCDICD